MNGKQSPCARDFIVMSGTEGADLPPVEQSHNNQVVTIDGRELSEKALIALKFAVSLATQYIHQQGQRGVTSARDAAVLSAVLAPVQQQLNAVIPLLGGGEGLDGFSSYTTVSAAYLLDFEGCRGAVDACVAPAGHA